jgi:hypothetical protein
MIMDAIHKLVSAIRSNSTHDALHRIDELEGRHREIKHQLSNIEMRTDALYHLVEGMKGPQHDDIQ